MVRAKGEATEWLIRLMASCRRRNQQDSTGWSIRLCDHRSRLSSLRSLCVLLSLLILLTVMSLPAHAAEPWYEAKTQRITVLTTLGDKRGREFALRFEQSRAIFGLLLGRDKVNLAQPLELIAFKDVEDFRHSLPAKLEGDETVTSFLVVGGERNYLVFAPVAEADRPVQWQRAGHDLAHLFLDGSYPPTQPWFDEGLAEYFSTAKIVADVEIGSDPDLARPQAVSTVTRGGSGSVVNNSDSAAEQRVVVPLRRSTIATLENTSWMPLGQLLSATPDIHIGDEQPAGSIFYAQSWLLVHYLLSHDQIANCGKYFDLVRIQGVPVASAIQQAFGIDVATLDQRLHTYFATLKAGLEPPTDVPSVHKSRTARRTHSVVMQNDGPIRHQPLPLGADDVAILSTKLDEADGRVRADEMLLHMSEHRATALVDLQNVESLFPKNTLVHRALGYSALQVKDFDLAQRDFAKAVAEAPEDPWTRYYIALLRYRYSLAQSGRLQNPGVIQQQLYVALSAYAQFPDALDLLGQAYTAGLQGPKAVETIRGALVLAPRNEWYVLHLGQAYTIAEKWESAQAIFERLVRTASSPVATEAKRWLAELPLRKRFGNALAQSGNGSPGLAPSPKPVPVINPLESTVEDEAEDARRAATLHSKPDQRPLQFLRGKLLRVDCSHPPAATLTVSDNGQIWKMHTPDSSRLVLIGADVFLCNWLDRNVYVNFRERNRGEGDLSSLELE